MKQLHDKRQKMYDIVNKLHDQRLSEQQGVCMWDLHVCGVCMAMVYGFLCLFAHYINMLSS